MPIIPALQELIETLPATTTLDLTDLPTVRVDALVSANALAEQVAGPGPEVASVTQAQVPVEGGAILVRVYRPLGDGPFPLHVFYHGGGWIAGTIEETFVDLIGRERAALAGYVTVTVEYRLAPEHPVPVPFDDCYAALLWAVEHASDFDADPARVTIGGGSAGGNLAAAVALRARDEQGPALMLQVLEVPALDLTGANLADEYGKGDYPLTSVEVTVYRDMYLGTGGDATHPYVSPLLALDLAGLPPAHIVSSEFDVLQPHGMLYAERLRAAGVPASFILGHGQIHGSSQFTRLLPESAAWRDGIIAVLRAHAHGAPTPATADQP